MSEKTKVIKIENKKVLVLPLISDACLSCNDSSCAKQGKPFWVKNSLQLPLCIGDVVNLKSSTAVKSFQAIVSLFFPITMAVIGYFVANSLYVKLYANQTVPEVWRVCGVLSFFTLSCCLVFARSYFFSQPQYAYISEILDKV
ncbi:MAG: SoxR reducing system RseC family protein [Treponemataceae bacterium]